MTAGRVVKAALAACLVAPATPVLAGAAPAGYAVVDRIAGPDGGWDFASVDPATGKLYIARSDAISAVDLATKAMTGHLADAHRGHEVLVLDGGATVFETDGETGLARFISAADGKVLAEVPAGRKPDAAFFDPKTGLIAVMNAGDGTIALIDPATRTLAGRIAVGGALEFGVADGKGMGFVNIEDRNAVARIDIADREVEATWQPPGCEGPTGLALVARGTRLIAACANETAVVLDAKTGQLVTSFAIGADPDAVLADEPRGLAFIPCGGSGTLVEVAIADPAAIRPLATIATQVSAKTEAIDPRDGRIYLPAATLAAPEPGARRGKPVPGTFVVLVVAPHA